MEDMSMEEIEARLEEINEEVEAIEFRVLLNYLVAEGMVTVEWEDGEERIYPAEKPVYIDLEDLCC